MKSIFTAIVIAFTLTVSGQVKDTFKLTSPLYYDSLGNVYYTQEVYDHIPTAKDSSQFERGTEKAMNLHFTEYRPGVPNKLTRKRNMYLVIVESIRYTKRGTILIRPYSNRKSPWYRYPFANVRVGDKVWVTDNMKIQPRF